MAINQVTANVLKGKDADVRGLAALAELSTAAGALVGFNGVTPIVTPVLATGTAKTVDNVITALQSIGLLKQA